MTPRTRAGDLRVPGGLMVVATLALVVSLAPAAAAVALAATGQL